MELPTSSESTPTEYSSVKDAEAKPKTKEFAGFKVDKSYIEKYRMAHVLPKGNATAKKCSGCQKVTIHSIIEVSMHGYMPGVETVKRRIIGCQNCGKISTK